MPGTCCVMDEGKYHIAQSVKCKLQGCVCAPFLYLTTSVGVVRPIHIKMNKMTTKLADKHSFSLTWFNWVMND